ncbi:hypothetical protein NQ318_021606 [Aromia moschata]|uniref:Uncharacterized protein n=1 Tax=Aromia moschata TaxID=1265417 RepID=A0AAV8YKS0_9CUCU|nr:hypothetical protein NQ318_021606 [Aromia moschata]
MNATVDMYYLSCNYGVGGNMLSSRIYKRGAPCSACSKGLRCNSEYKGLCGKIVVAGAERLELLPEMILIVLLTTIVFR